MASQRASACGTAPGAATIRPMSINGFLTLGTALSGMVVVPPPSGTGYAPQPISFDLVPGGVTLNDISCVFGPVSGSWGTLSVFGVTDQASNPYWSGTLSAPYAPVNGQLVIVPQGNIALVVGAQIFATPAAAPVPRGNPAIGSTVSGTVGLSSGSYVLAVAAGPRDMLLLTNTGTGSVNVILGGTLPPVSGAQGYSIVPPLGSWPPPGLPGFTPTSQVWVLSSVDGVALNTLVGHATATASAASGPTTSSSVVMSSGAYVSVLASGARDLTLLTNTSSGSVNIVLGGASPPSSGAAGYSIIPPFGTWPPPGFGNFVPTDSIWALSSIDGVTLNAVTG